MKIIPVNKKVLLKPLGVGEKKTSGGIYLTEDAPEMNKATVVALGDKVELKLKPGDTVLYDDLGADKVGDRIIVEEIKIIAILK